MPPRGHADVSPPGRITYRTGGSAAVTVCVRHAGAAVTFQCHACLDWLCARCLARGKTDVCALCHEAITREKAGAPLARARPRAVSRTVVGLAVIIALAVGGAAWWLFLQPPSGTLPSSDVAVVSALVERRRDAQGFVPADLGPFVQDLAPDVRERVASGAIRYQPSADRRSYEVTTATVPGGSR